MSSSGKRLRHRPADRSLERRVKFFVKTWQGRILHPRFQRIKERTNGMMLAPVYKRLYQEVYKLPDGDIVEIGGAAGASAITAATARVESKRTGKVITVERCDGQNRSRYGGYKDNLEIFQENVRDFNVEDRVVLFPHYLSDENAAEVNALVTGDSIVGLIHDADGRIDRDFRAFLPRLIDGGLIVIDDYLPQITVELALAKKDRRGFDKFIITSRLLKRMMDWGLYEHIDKVGGTAFGRRPAGADASRIDPEECKRIVEDVRSELGLPDPGASAPTQEQVA